ncbi:MAG TPA: SIMPL domain-containing protein, partial [Gaiellaceae bacterium]|nr:SIMPL domain-containing protein [Gaiellaceae bacterium]
MKLLRLALLCAAIAAVVAFVGVGLPARGGSAVDPARTITVSGTGTVSAVPTQAGFDFGVSTRAKTAQQALADDSAQMRKLIAALEAAGVPAASLQTSSVSLEPVTSGDDSAIVGYSASNTVSATVAQLSKAGAVVDAAVAAGANQVDGPNLTVADQRAQYDQALKAAVADARAKAQVLAAAGGLQVGA